MKYRMKIFSEKSSDESYNSHDESSSNSERSYKENVASGYFFLLEDSDVCKGLVRR